MWAPSVIEKDGKYYMFFGAHDVQPGQIGGIGVGFANKPQGPLSRCSRKTPDQ
jgi:beta-xylosidase